jgi:small-conductance mechanosensitive channel
VLADPAPGVGLNRFTPEGYELDVGFWIDDPENGVGGVVSDLNKKIFALVQTGQLKLAMTTLDVRLMDAMSPTVVSRIAQTEAS